MTTLVSTLLSNLATEVQEDDQWSNGFWSVEELIVYINDVSKDFVLKTQIMKVADAIAAVAAQRIYDQNSYTSQMDRIAFNNTALDRTTKFSLDHQDIKWRTLAGVPKQYHQDQLPVQQFEVDRAPTSGQVGRGYTAAGLYGTLRQAISGTRVTDAGIASGFPQLNSASAPFALTDVGASVIVVGAGSGGSTLTTTIASFVSSTQVVLTVNASTTVAGAVAAWGTLYGVSGSGYGVLRYLYGTRPYNGILPNGRPYAGTLRQALTGLTNFEALATRLVDDVEDSSDLMRVPDFTMVYIKYGVLAMMLAKEGEQQDMVRAQYAKARYDRGIQLFRKVLGVKTEDMVLQNG